MRTQQRRQCPEEPDETLALEALRQHQPETGRGRRRAAAEDNQDNPAGNDQPQRGCADDYRELEVVNERRQQPAKTRMSQPCADALDQIDELVNVSSGWKRVTVMRTSHRRVGSKRCRGGVRHARHVSSSFTKKGASPAALGTGARSESRTTPTS